MAQKDFLDAYLPPQSAEVRTASNQRSELRSWKATPQSVDTSVARPFVTLTYACSLDSMISLAPGVRTTLSGPETKSMTHYLRLQHDAILVGVGTAVADDPSLNCRYPGATLETQPQPLILDPSRRFDLEGSRLSKLVTEEKGRFPWILRRRSALDAEHMSCENKSSHVEIVCRTQKAADDSEIIDWSDILATLLHHGINSVMIEGGATVINHLLRRPDLVDAVIVTIAPTWLGQGGTVVSPAPRIEAGEKLNAANLGHTAWQQFGSDVVLCGKLTS